MLPGDDSWVLALDYSHSIHQIARELVNKKNGEPTPCDEHFAARAGSNTVVIRINDTATPPFTQETIIDVKLHTAAGKEYPMMVA